MKIKKRLPRTLPQSSENEFGQFLSRARQKTGMTMAEAADKLGLNSGQSIWDWENGKGSGIPAEMLMKLVKVYGLSVDRVYEPFLKFHQQRTEDKVRRKFNEAKQKFLRAKKN